MRKVIVTNIVSLDGYYADEHGNPVVLNMDPAFDAYNLERITAADTVLLGRASFQMFGSYWPHVADAPDEPGSRQVDEVNRGISRRYNAIPRILVVSDTLEVPGDHPWAAKTEVVSRADAAARIRREQEAEGGDIVVFGSHLLWNGLLADGLVDELHLMVGPNVLGAGVPLFERPVDLELLDARRLPGSSNVLHVYAPVR